jgi:hypothetical protein
VQSVVTFDPLKGTTTYSADKIVKAVTYLVLKDDAAKALKEFQIRTRNQRQD